MLVLSRRCGEEVVIGENIRLTIVAIDRNHVRLGITAPAQVPILRAELCPAVPGADDPSPPALAAVARPGRMAGNSRD
ncbi:MAG TPA: carbon storage regulator [Gemmataceae bacterium]|jgi:carbon storage regulator|nr:carbon storage regulator [Gemmataceae bacterium]